MFRIHFDPKLGRFIVQIHHLGMFWRSVMALNEDKSGTDLLMFKTFDEASEYVKSIGLDKLYRDMSVNKFREFERRQWVMQVAANAELSGDALARRPL